MTVLEKTTTCRQTLTEISVFSDGSYLVSGSKRDKKPDFLFSFESKLLFLCCDEDFKPAQGEVPSDLYERNLPKKDYAFHSFDNGDQRYVFDRDLGSEEPCFPQSYGLGLYEVRKSAMEGCQKGRKLDTWVFYELYQLVQIELKKRKFKRGWIKC